MKRRTSILIALVLVLTMLIGCTGGGGGTPTSAPVSGGSSSGGATSAPAKTDAPAEESNINEIGTLPIVKEKIELSVLQYIRDTDATTMSGLWYAEKIEEDTNIHINYTQVNQSDWNTQANLMFASGDYTDIIVNAGTGQYAIDSEVYGVDQGILLTVNDLVDEYMPVYKGRLDEDLNAWESLVRSDGNMYAIGNMADYGSNHDGEYFINQKWLDEAQLPTPTNTEELYEALKAFVTADSSRLGYTGTFDEMTTYLTHMWGIPENPFHVSIDDDRQVRYNVFMPGYRDYVEYMHRLYAEGIMDPNSITQDANTKISKYNQNNVGFTTMHRLMSMGWDVLQEDMVFLLPPAAEGYSVVFKSGFGVASERVYFTMTNKNLVESALWVDYQLQDQPTFESFYGPEGTLWDWNADGKCELGPAGDQGVFEYALGVNGIYYMPSYYYNQVFQQPDYRLERIEYCEIFKDEGMLEKYPYTYLNQLLPLTADEQSERTQLQANLEPLYDETVADMIMHGVTDAKWDSFMNSLKAAGTDRFVELYQTALDRYFNK